MSCIENTCHEYVIHQQTTILNENIKSSIFITLTIHLKYTKCFKRKKAF